MHNYINDEMVLHIVEKGISSLGETPTQATWYCLERDFNFNKQTVPENLGRFQEALQKLFGPGSTFLDILFRDYLKEATGEDLSKYSSFSECVTALREKKREESRLTFTAKEPEIATWTTVRVTKKSRERDSR